MSAFCACLSKSAMPIDSIAERRSSSTRPKLADRLATGRDQPSERVGRGAPSRPSATVRLNQTAELTLQRSRTTGCSVRDR